METEITDIGKVAITPQKDYKSEQTYEWLDVVTYDGAGYMCISKDGCTGIVPTNTNYWQLLADKGHFTEEDKEEFKKAVVEESKTEINEHTGNKKTELNNYTTELEKSLENELDTYKAEKETQMDSHKATLETEMANKKDSLIEEIETVQNGFDANVEEKTNTFNSNVETKTTEFNNNSNAKTEEFNNNSTEKINAFNSNAEEKIADYNAHVETLTSRIAELEEETEDLYNALPIEEASGTVLYIEDAKPCRVINAGISGMYKQETTKGINLINVNEQLNNTINGITKRNNKDGSLKLTGTATAETKIQLRTGTLEEGKYTYKCFGNQTDCVTNIYYVGNVTKENIRVFTVSADSTNNYVFTYVIPKSTTINVTIKPMLVNGEYTADTFPDFEPFTGAIASPNPNYPQKIKTVVGSVEIDIVNKNFLDIEDIEEIERDGIKYSVKNGILKLNGTSTASFDIQLSKNIKIKKGKYTHSSNYIQSGLYISFDNLEYTMLSATAEKKRTFELKEDKIYTKYFIWIDKGIVLNNVEIKPQLEKGDTTTNFIEHQSQTSVMPIQQEMLEGDYIEDVEHHAWRKIVLDGTENWSEIATNNLKRFFCNINVTGINNNNSVNCISNYFKSTSRNRLELSNGDEVAVAGNFLNILSKNIETKEDFKAYLKQQFDSGNPVIVYYKLAEPVDLELTEKQKEVKKRKLYTYEDITNVSLNDELASCKLTYVQDVKKLLEKQAEQQNARLDNIEALLSTTETSALLLDNMQTDLEKEVE